MATTGRIEGYTGAIVERLRSVLCTDLVGVYLHGSLVLSDFSEARGDVDAVAVTTRSLSREEKREIGEHLSQRSLPCPAAGLEFHVLVGDGIALSEAPRFDLHLATSTDGRPDRVVDGEGHRGDPDLVMHFAVLRDYGRALVGPPPERVFPAIPRPMLLDAFRGELKWARKNASPSYQVLNACRAWRYVDEGMLCSKTAGGEWARERVDDPSTIDAALRHRSGLTDAHPDPDTARAVLLDALRLLNR